MAKPLAKPWQPSDPWRTRHDEVSIPVHVPEPARGLRVRTFADVAVETLESLISSTEASTTIDAVHMLSLFATGGLRLGSEVITPSEEEQAERERLGEARLELKLILGKDSDGWRQS